MYFSCILCEEDLCAKCYANQFGEEKIRATKKVLYFKIKNIC